MLDAVAFVTSPTTELSTLHTVLLSGSSPSRKYSRIALDVQLDEAVMDVCYCHDNQHKDAI